MCFGLMFLNPPPPPCASLAATVAAMGNILFVAGTFLIIGPRRTSTYFLQKEKMRGTVCFALGFLMVIWGWAFFGLVIEVRPRASAASPVVGEESGVRLVMSRPLFVRIAQRCVPTMSLKNRCFL